MEVTSEAPKARKNFSLHLQRPQTLPTLPWRLQDGEVGFCSVKPHSQLGFKARATPGGQDNTHHPESGEGTYESAAAQHMDSIPVTLLTTRA